MLSVLTKKRHTFSVMGIFRNEDHVLAEWCQHYISQGAGKIYLINHLSSDNYRSVLEKYQYSGIVELSNVEGEHPQIPAYNALRPRIKKSSRWLLICDLDEFVYGRKGMSIKSYLESLPWLTSEVVIPWKNFGSSGHLRHPNGYITQNFLYRESYASRNSESDSETSSEPQVEPHQAWCKYVVRTNRIRHLAVHYSSVWYGRVVDANGKHLRNYDGNCTLPISEQFLEDSSLHLNHYPIQSLEYFKRVKMNRPDVNCPNKDNSKTLEYFEKADRNDIFDPELSLSCQF